MSLNPSPPLLERTLGLALHLSPDELTLLHPSAGVPSGVRVRLPASCEVLNPLLFSTQLLNLGVVPCALDALLTSGLEDFPKWP